MDSTILLIFKLISALLIIYIASNSRITIDKEFRLLFWVPTVCAMVASGLINYEFRDLALIALLLCFGFMLGVYSLHFAKRDKSPLDFLKLFWLVTVILSSAMKNFYRYMDNKSITDKYFFNDAALIAKVEYTLDGIIVCTSLLIAVLIYLNKRQVAKGYQYN